MDPASTTTFTSMKNPKLNQPFLLGVENVQLPLALEHVELRRRLSILQTKPGPHAWFCQCALQAQPTAAKPTIAPLHPTRRGAQRLQGPQLCTPSQRRHALTNLLRRRPRAASAQHRHHPAHGETPQLRHRRCWSCSPG